jgi:hypothetical protein
MVRVVNLGVVMCPGCDQPMIAVEDKPVLSTDNLVEVTYVCERCKMTTNRLLSADALIGGSQEN